MDSKERKQAENDLQKCSDELVPSSGKSKTIEGEMVRAMMRIIYRYYNDGDYFFEGYGCETAGPAHSFLINCEFINIELQNKLKVLFNEAVGLMDDAYEDVLWEASNVITSYIIKNGFDKLTHSDVDMFDYKSEYEDLEEDWC